MHRGLRVDRVRHQLAALAVVQSDAGIVAGGLDAEDQHRIILIQFSPFSDLRSLMPTVRVKENEHFEVAMRRFKRTVATTGHQTELRFREYYLTSTDGRKRNLG